MGWLARSDALGGWAAEPLRAPVGRRFPPTTPRQPSPITRRGRGYTSALPQTSAAHEAVPTTWSSRVPASSPLPQELDLEPRPTCGPILEVKVSGG